MSRSSLLAATAFALALAGCAGGASTTPPRNLATPVATPTPTPNPGQTGQVSGSPISHVVVVIQENRTFDNLFGSSILASGGPYPGANAVIPAEYAPSQCAAILTAPSPENSIYAQMADFYDPGHSHDELVAEWDNGAMDGFAADPLSLEADLPGVSTTNAGPAYPCHIVSPYENEIYHLIADQYALADDFFSSRLTPTFPGHQYLIAGQSPGSDDPSAPAGVTNANTSIVWGCDSTAGSTVPTFTGTGNATTEPAGVFPCFDYATLGDLMDTKGVSWRYYTGTIGSADGTVDAYDAIHHIRFGTDWTRNIVTPESQILTDVQNCNLPAVSYVTPPTFASDHAGNLSAGGPGWVASIYLAIAQTATSTSCNYYGNTAVLVTWDDSGGWYDHVAPPAGTNWGFRVPLIVASAWSAQSKTPPLPYVSHTQREFGSIVKYIEENWGLGSLGTNDASADDLHDMFNYTGKPVAPIEASKLRKLITISANEYLHPPPSKYPVDDDK
jgi:phospholipase C